MDKKIIVASLYIKKGLAVKSRKDDTVLGDIKDFAKKYNDSGIDKIIIYDLSNDDDEHVTNISAIRELNRMIEIPTCGCGNIRRMEDIKQLFYAGCKQVILNGSKQGCMDLATQAAERFGKDRILVSILNVDFVFKHQNEMSNIFHEVVVLKDDMLDTVDNLTETPYVVCYEGEDILKVHSLLERTNCRGICGHMFNDPEAQITGLKSSLSEMGLWMDNFEPAILWEDLKKNSDGLVPCIVQDYKTDEVLMLAYMNEESYDKTISCGKMTYYSRSRKKLWLKGETSGHLQYVKSLTADCDKDTLLAKVSQVGVACHTGKPSCFFNEIVSKEYTERNPLKVFDNIYNDLDNHKKNPKDGSYVNYLFDKGLNKILKKIGEESTEVVIAALSDEPETIKYEITDLLYHLMFMMVEKGVTWEDITQELSQR